MYVQEWQVRLHTYYDKAFALRTSHGLGAQVLRGHPVSSTPYIQDMGATWAQSERMHNLFTITSLYIVIICHNVVKMVS